MERPGYGRERGYYGGDGYGPGGSEQVHGHQDGHGEEYQDWHDADFGDDCGNGDDAEDLAGAVEHQAWYADDAEAEEDRLSVQFGWRFKARGSRRGRKWLPPDTKLHRTPVFVRLEDLQKRGGDSLTDVPLGPSSEEQPS